MNNNIVIINYGMGNIKSISNAITILGYKHIITNNSYDVKKSEIIFLPGVGAFGEAIKNLKKLGLINVIKNHCKTNKPIFGICLGMQILLSESEENGFHKGLDLIPGKVVKIITNKKNKLPHVGWNNVYFKRQNFLFKNIKNNTNFYFDHSYETVLEKKYITSYFKYNRSIVSSISKDNIFGTQFHPEKSDYSGLNLIKNFLSKYA